MKAILILICTIPFALALVLLMFALRRLVFSDAETTITESDKDPRYEMARKLQDEATTLNRQAAKQYKASLSHSGDRIKAQADQLYAQARQILDEIREDEETEREIRKLEVSPYPTKNSTDAPYGY